MAERAFCKAYLDLKAEAAKANELDALEKQIGKLKGEARRYEELGGGREKVERYTRAANRARLPNSAISTLQMAQKGDVHLGKPDSKLTNVVGTVSQSSLQVHDLAAKKRQGWRAGWNKTANTYVIEMSI
jgi:hypothetical protein